MGLTRVCVFCGSSIGRDPVYKAAARKLGSVIGKGGKTLVYGGGNIGLMGEIARTVLDTSPHGDDAVVGFIPDRLADREVSGNLLGRTRVVSDMHERKAAMAAEAEAFIAMPGGFGTMEEVLEMITWQQLGFHTKPVGVLNVNGFFDSLLAFFDSCVNEGFISKDSRRIVVVSDSAEDLIAKLESYTPPTSVVDTLKQQSRNAPRQA